MTGKVGRNFVGETELYKRRIRMTAGAFSLCASELVKFTPGGNLIK